MIISKFQLIHDLKPKNYSQATLNATQWVLYDTAEKQELKMTAKNRTVSLRQSGGKLHEHI